MNESAAEALAALRSTNRLPLRTLARASGALGYASGAWSRWTRNLEVWRGRSSAPTSEEMRPCPLCGAGKSAMVSLRTLRTSNDLRDLGDFHLELCTACEVARTWPNPVDGARVISPDVAPARTGALQRMLLDRFIAERVQRVRPLLPSGRTALVVDVGAGACGFANALARTGCAVTAFEPNAGNAAAAGPGVRFVAELFNEQSVVASGIADGTVDAVTMWHSLEHVESPLATLALARRLLRPGGCVYVCVPNLDSLQSDLAAEWWCYLDIPHHISHFTPEGLARALARSGFGGVEAHWWSEEYEIFGFYQSLLNVLTRSQNYFYNRAKKGRASDAGPWPAWTRLMTSAGPALLPAALLYAWWGAAMSKPACVEMHAFANASPTGVQT